MNHEVETIMPLTNLDAIQQALANIELESMSISPELQALLYKALVGGGIDTKDLLSALLKC